MMQISSDSISKQSGAALFGCPYAGTSATVSTLATQGLAEISKRVRLISDRIGLSRARSHKLGGRLRRGILGQWALRRGAAQSPDQKQRCR